jgi:hypothetical protein
MLAKCYEDLVAHGYIQWKVMGNDWSDKGEYGDRKRTFGWIGLTLGKDDSEPCMAALQWNPQGTRLKDKNDSEPCMAALQWNPQGTRLKEKARKLMATNCTERMWKAQLE